MHLLGKPSAGASSVDEFAGVVVSQQQGADAVTAIRGFGKAANYKLLLLETLQLNPVSTSP